MRKALMIATALVTASVCVTAAFGQLPTTPAQPVIMTGGKTGDYYLYFAPPLKTLLDKAWVDAVITTSDGTPENMNYVLAHPTSYALAQGNVFADLTHDPKYQSKFQILPATIGNEAVLGILSDRVFQRAQGSFGAVVAHAKQVRWALPPASSGPGRTFQELMQLNPQLAQAENGNVVYYPSMDAAIQAVANGQADAALMVQFPNPANPRFKQIHDYHEHIVPVVLPEMKSLKLPDGRPAFTLCENAEVGPGETIDTACSPILAITGAANDNPDLAKVFAKVTPEDFAPKSSNTDFLRLWHKLKASSVQAFDAAADKANKLAGKLADQM